MNAKQIGVLALGVLLLALNFTFPITSRPTRRQSEDRRAINITATTTFVPIWTALAEHENATLKGNMFDDTIIRWPVVAAIAAAIILLSGLWVYRLGQPSAGAAGRGG
jgi:hypothetical protein